ncbi:hypothetical protein QN277_003615 [Acacia crassicarpa]|uniref:Retrovirus-related Pol polyprotein from transposon RE1 n=1 Tax=Acacia crassicarpa TaxID=499986 RepID=A0AAE1MHK0_9FABA|nr:hypothetical protein QN277_003615 [Acacia crassicarpa]
MGMSGCKPLSIPMKPGLKLLAYEEGRDRKEDLLSNPERYRRLVGRLIYLTNTRPDISFPVQVVSQFMQAPTKAHMAAARSIVRYLKQSVGVGVLLSSNQDLNLSCFSDADWGACGTTRRSGTTYLLKLGDSLIKWKSKKQETVSRSSAEVEYRALGSGVAEVVWATGMIKHLSIPAIGPVSVYCDSKAAIHIASNPVFHKRTKHIEIDLHFVREKLQGGLIELQHVSLQNQEADIFTKALSKEAHSRLLSKLGTVNVFRAPNLRGSVKNNV